MLKNHVCVCVCVCACVCMFSEQRTSLNLQGDAFKELDIVLVQG